MSDVRTKLQGFFNSLPVAKRHQSWV